MSNMTIPEFPTVGLRPDHAALLAETRAQTEATMAETAVLRVLHDAEGSVPLADLDDLAGRAPLAAALARLTRAGVVDVQAGYAALAPARLHRTDEEVEP